MSKQEKEESKGTYSILLPPPNLTGSLHMGHALDFFLQHALLLEAEQDGIKGRWHVGFDHAGIATQTLVEKEMRDQGLDPEKMDDEEFIEKTTKWVEGKRANIIQQIEKMGLKDAADWDEACFTMDEACKQAVTKAFVQLHKDGLIYRGQRMVNWDCVMQTALSDLEVDHRDVGGQLYYIKYGDSITVATTRPETIFGDEALMLHPEDKRKLGGKAMIPLTTKEIPIIRDNAVDMKYGSGVVKVTPAHDFNDFEVGRRHNLPLTVIIDERGQMAGPCVPEQYRGLDRLEARKRVVADLKEAGLLAKIEQHRHSVPYGDRSGLVLEPRLTDQWFIDAKKMAAQVLPRLRFIEDYKTQEELRRWLINIDPWCISRQIRWGHRIPVWWYGKDGQYVVAESEEEAQRQAPSGAKLTRDPDVLDTWFSSALWPMLVLGWDGGKWEGHNDYPFDVLVTGSDILFFWVARMMMMGLHFTRKMPFKRLMLHPIVRDSKGHKMSKSRGNVIDPIEMVDKWGLDAVRWALISKCGDSRNIKLDERDFRTARNLMTKLDNAATFCILHQERLDKKYPPRFNIDLREGFAAERYPIIIYMMQLTEFLPGKGWQSDVTTRIRLRDGDGFKELAERLRDVFWKDFCDIYVEYVRFNPLYKNIDDGSMHSYAVILFYIFFKILKGFGIFVPDKARELTEKLEKHVDIGKYRVGISPPDKGKVDDSMSSVQEFKRLRKILGSMNGPLLQNKIPPLGLYMHFGERLSEFAAHLAGLGFGHIERVEVIFFLAELMIYIPEGADICVPLRVLERERDQLIRSVLDRKARYKAQQYPTEKYLRRPDFEPMGKEYEDETLEQMKLLRDYNRTIESLQDAMETIKREEEEKW